MNIRSRIGKLEMTVGRWQCLQELSNAELEARIRKAGGLDDSVALTDDLLHNLRMGAHMVIAGVRA